MLLTHAHLDHCGRLPLLCARGFTGKIYCTEATAKIAHPQLESMLEHGNGLLARKPSSNQRAHATFTATRCAYVLRMASQNRQVLKGYRADFLKDGATMCSLCVERQAAGVLGKATWISYGAPLKVAEGITVTAFNAGHIPGSAGYKVQIRTEQGEVVLYFSGDIGGPGAPLNGPAAAPPDCQYLLVESTYGDVARTESDVRTDDFLNELQKALGEGRDVIIPCNALQKAQAILHTLSAISLNNPIVLTSSTAADYAKIYEILAQNNTTPWFNDAVMKSLRSGKPLCAPFTFDRSPKLGGKVPQIAIASSGDAQYSVARELVLKNIGNPRAAIFFTSFLPEGSVGYQTLNAALAQKKSVEIAGTEYPLRAQVRRFNCFSSHMDSRDIVAWLKGTRISKHAFVVHGVPEASAALAKLLDSTLHIESSVPRHNQTVELTP